MALSDFTRPDFCDYRATSGCGPRPMMVGWPFVAVIADKAIIGCLYNSLDWHLYLST
jgi:hypothetical protein